MSLLDLVERERRALARLLNASGATLVVGAVGGVLALGAIILGSARWLSLPRLVPFLLWAGAIGVVVGGARLIAVLRRRMATLPGVAGEIEKERKLRDGSLRGTIEVAGSGALGRLGAEAMARRLGEVGHKPLAPTLRARMLRWVGVGLTAAAAGGAALVAGTGMAPDGWAAMLHPLRAWNGTLLEGVHVDSLPGSVLRGERISVTVRAPGRREVSLAYRRTGATWREMTLPVIDGVASTRLEPLDADLTLYATDGRALSDTSTVRVVERPFIGEVNVRAQFSGYLGRQTEIIPLGEPVRVPQGTRLTVEGTSSTELREVTLTRGAVTLILRPEGLRFSGPVPTATGRYEWAAVGRTGPITDVPPALEIEVVPDSAPTVEILSPGGDTTVTAGDSLNLSVMAIDDHGILHVAVRSWIVDGRGARRDLPEVKRSANNEGQWSGETPLRTDQLRPGDALHVVAAATDGSPWTQTGLSRELVIRLPTLSEQRDAIRDAADSTVARATATAAAQRQLQQRTQEASKQRSQQQMSFESAEQAKSLAREQRELADRMEQVKQSAEQLERQLQEAGGLDSSLQRQLDEAQKLLRDALTPELAEQLRKLEQASQQLSPEDARKAMADLAQQQQRIREQLEKSVEMLKRAALEGSMSTLTDEAKELAKRQREIADSLARSQTPEDRAEAQRAAKEAAEKTRELSEEVKELQQRLQQQKAEAGTERVNEAERRMQQSAEAMERAAQNAQQREQAQARDSAQKAPQGQQQQQGRQGGEQQQQGRQGGQPQQGQQGQQGQPQQGQQGGRGREGQPQQGGQQQGGQQQGAEKQGAPQQGGRRDQSVEDAARQAAAAMDDAARELSQAREQQVSEWKQELTTELDRSIQEMIQLAREQQGLEQQARRGTSPEALRAQQGSLQQGVEKSAQRLQDAAQRSSLLTQRSLRTVADARKRVEDATQQTRAPNTNATQIAQAMKEASEALNGAAASLVRDRERAAESSSATGFAEMLKQLQEMAQQQGSLNSAAQSLLPRIGTQAGQQQSRQLAKQQREVAAKLDDVGDRDDSGRSEELAKEARQIAAALEAAQIDPAVIERQQRLFRKMLDAGRLMEEEEREDTGKREAKSWTGTEVFTPQGTSASGRSATRFEPPTWNDLRGLSPDERRIVLEYFKRINGQRP
jgi:hypothetical protein